MSGRLSDWQRSRFERVEAALAQPAATDLPTVNRSLRAAAVADPLGIERERRVRVIVNADVLDRLLQARRIGPSEHAAGRTYQRLLEISLGAPLLDGTGLGARVARGDDVLARVIERAGLVLVELVRIRRRIGWRSERLLRLTLVELNPDTGQSWTLEQIARAQGRGDKSSVFALSQRLVESVEDLAAHWHRVELD